MKFFDKEKPDTKIFQLGVKTGKNLVIKNLHSQNSMIWKLP